MGWQNISVDDIPPVMEYLFSQGKLTKNQFAFYLTSNPATDSSKLTIGGYDSNYAPNGFNNVKLISETYWMIAIDGIKVGDEKITVSNAKGVVDSGTSLLVGDNTIVSQITPKLGTVASDCSNINDLPDLTFTLGGEEYVLTSADWVIKVTGNGQSECISGIQGTDFPSQLSNTVILGDVFMRKFYTLFDYTNKSVGFAK